MRYVSPLWLWASRDLIRHPIESVLLAAALFSVIIVASVSLLICQGISDTAERLIEHGPSVVVRRVVAGHWVPVPVEEAVNAAVSVPGVISATPRIWGVVNGPEGPVTIIGNPLSNEKILNIYPELGKSPGQGEALIGPGVLSGNLNEKMDSELILLNGRRELKVKVTGVITAANSMVIHDIILLDENDARHILELEHGYAGDLAIYVFHEQESNAILPDLVDAFPWPVSLTTKNETLKLYTASATRRAGLIYLALIPSLLALALIVAAGYKCTQGRKYEAGLLKALGWTTKEVVGFIMCRAALIAFPASAFGMAVSYALVYLPGISWPCYLFFGWKSNAPGLYLDPTGSLWILFQVVAGVLVPYLVSHLWPAIEIATADPHQLLQEDGAI
jgi:hypothetical protein